MKNTILSIKRASYREQTLKPFFEINKNLKIFSDYFFSILKCLIFCFKNDKNDTLKLIYCDGNTNTINSKIIKFFFKKIKYYCLWFNSPIEINQFKNDNSIIHLCFFSEQQKYIKNKKNSHVIPFPKNFIIKNLPIYNYLTSYISEVNINISAENYPTIFSLEKKNKELIDNFIWTAFKNFKFSDISNFDFSFYTLKKIEVKKSDKFLLLPEIYGLYKNRLRFLAIKKICKQHPKGICLIGGSWENYGFKTLRNNYNYDDNKNIYKNTKAPVDFGASTGEFPIYLRTYELLNNASFFLQSRTRFSKKVFGNLCEKITFNTFDEMLFLLKNISLLSQLEFFSLKKKLKKNLNNIKILNKTYL